MAAESKKRPSRKSDGANSRKPKVTGRSKGVKSRGEGTRSLSKAASKAGLKKTAARKLPGKKSKAAA